MKVELVIVWATGEKEIAKYDTVEDAEKAQAGLQMAFGNQISWMGIR